MAFSDILRELRKEKGLSQRELSKEIGISQSSITKYEKGLREPTASVIIRLAAYLEVSADYLLGITD